MTDVIFVCCCSSYDPDTLSPQYDQPNQPTAEYAEPIKTLPHANNKQQVINSGYSYSDNIYNDVDTPSQDGSHPASAGYHYSVVKKESQPDVPPTDNYSRLQHEAAQPSGGSTAVYSRLDHTQSTELDVSLAVNGVYSSLEDSNAPLYNSLQTPHTHTPANSGGNEVFDDPNYSNLTGNQLGRTGGGELHPHYTGNYERASDYITPTLRNGQGQEHSGDHGRDH